MFEENDDLNGSEQLGTGDLFQETPPEQPQPFEIPDDAFVSVKVNGEDKLLPWKEARSGVMFQSAFTQKTQDLARQRQEYEQERQQFETLRQQYDQQITRLSEALKNPSTLAALYMHAASLSQPQSQQPTPLTTDALPKLEQSLEQKFQGLFGKYQEQLARERQAERFEQELDSFMKGVLANHPLLKAIDGIEDTIYGRVANLGVKSLDEAKEQARLMVESMSLQAQKAYEEQQKRAALDKANALRNGAEPRGGQGVVPIRKDVKRLEDLDNDFLAYLQQQDRAGQ